MIVFIFFTLFAGIDCRSVQERALGQFPKAYAFDPILLTDSDEIVKLLDMVETMAATAHLCLIGILFKSVCGAFFMIERTYRILLFLFISDFLCCRTAAANVSMITFCFLFLGAGEGYLRWVHEQQSSSKYRKYQNNPVPVTGGAGNTGGASIRARDPPELVRAFEDYYSKLNAVAMFFLKRSFKHVR